MFFLPRFMELANSFPIYSCKYTNSSVMRKQVFSVIFFFNIRIMLKIYNKTYILNILAFLEKPETVRTNPTLLLWISLKKLNLYMETKALILWASANSFIEPVFLQLKNLQSPVIYTQSCLFLWWVPLLASSYLFPAILSKCRVQNHCEPLLLVSMQGLNCYIYTKNQTRMW